MVSKDDISLLPTSSNIPSVGRSLQTRPKALINPFDPSHVTIKLTSNRRRWTHVFPLGPTGIFMQQHHYQAVPQNTACTMLPSEACVSSDKEENRKISTSQIRSSDHPWASSQSRHHHSSSTSKTSPRTSSATEDRVHRSSVRGLPEPAADSSLTYAWGATGEQEWTPAITTGVDWKSLVVPACLPITTDFFPDKRSLNNDYVMNCYPLLPEDQGAELLNRVCYRGGEDLRNHIPFSTQQVLEELTCQRLQQGFQLIIFPKGFKGSSFGSKNTDNTCNTGNTEYILSIGRIFHRLQLLDKRKIDVTQYKPRHPYPTIEIHYCYRFRAPDNKTFGVSWVDFTSDRLENYNWNYLDNYICLRGEEEYELRDELKFWRFRLLVLPNICQNITKRITEPSSSGEPQLRCLGAYRESTHEDRIKLFQGFLKFIELISKIKRDPPKRIRQHHHSGRGAPTSPNLEPKSRNPSGTQMVKSPRVKTFEESESTSGPQSVDSCSHFMSQLQFEKSKIPLPELKEIADRMSNDSNITFIMNQKGLPPKSFISAEAIFWMIDTYGEIKNEATAVRTFQRMIDEGLMCHCSRDIKFPFISGFYLYFMVPDKFYKYGEVDLEMFQKDWLEIEMCLKEISNVDDQSPSNPWQHRFHKS